jgi:hypothetical protein
MTLTSQPLWLVLLSLGLTGSIVGAIIAAAASALIGVVPKTETRS